MKKNILWFFLIFLLCGISFITGWTYHNHIGRTADSLSLKEEDFIKQILLLSGERIFDNRCRVFSSEGTLIKSPLVADFLLSYIRYTFLLDKRDNDNITFGCGDFIEENHCGLGFGRAGKQEGWGRYLRFKYDPETNKIEKNTFGCIDT